MKPIGNLVLIRPRIEKEQITDSGIVLPDIHKDPSIVGEVLDYGPGLQAEDGSYVREEIEIGDVVVFKRYTAYEKEVDEEILCLVPDIDIVAIVPPNVEVRGKK